MIIHLYKDPPKPNKITDHELISPPFFFFNDFKQ